MEDDAQKPVDGGLDREEGTDRTEDVTRGGYGQPGHGLSRRSFLVTSGLLGGTAAYDAAAAKARLVTNVFPVPPGVSQVISQAISEIDSILSDTKPTFAMVLRRREDFLFLGVFGYNLARHGDKLGRVVSGPAYIVFTFEPQHITEEAYSDPGGSPKSPGKSRALMAYPSRIAFEVPSGKTIPLTVDALLDWAALTPSLTQNAAYDPQLLAIARDIANPGHGGTVHLPPPSKPARPPRRIYKPTDVQTAIELPWRLAISPTGDGGSWSHPREVLTSQGWSELWHTRLAADATETATDGGEFRAIWAYDPGFSQYTAPPNTDVPFRTSLNPFYRWQIVNATSNFNYQGKGRADVTANKLWLSTRGGFLDSEGIWDLNASLGPVADLGEWKHLATLGRDQYVKIVEKGYLFPFGHKVVQTIVTERKFENVGGRIVATSRQITYLVVREATKIYDGGETYGLANNARDFPFRSLTLKTLRTPDLDPLSAFTTLPANDCFVPNVSGAPFQWHFVGTDWIGQEVAFTAPGVFVIQDEALTASDAATVRNKYNSLPLTDSRRIGNFTGQEVAFAESYTAGDTNHTVQSIVFGANQGTGPSSGGLQDGFANADQPICYPNVAQASVVLSAAQQASGGDTSLASPVEVSYDPVFVTGGGFNTSVNKGNVYLGIGGTGPSLTFGGGSSGGVITPNLSLTGLSRSLGPVAGAISDLQNGQFNPESVFAGSLDATILGGVKLIDLIQAVTGISGDSPPLQAMQIVYSTVQSATGMAADQRRGHQVPTVPPVPTTRTTNFNWSPDIIPAALQNNPIVTNIVNSDGSQSSTAPTFTLSGSVTTDLTNPKNSTFKLKGDLESFAVTLMTTSTAFITINFNSLVFTSASGQKSNVNVDIANVMFDGPLAFVQQLEDFMDFSGSGGPKITISPTGISADLSVTLPPIAVGIFSLSNIGIDAGFNLPFIDGPARFRFSFSTQDNPFTLSVAIFGGSGFFGIAIGTDGVELIQASFDFGAMASIDLGVASGSVQLVAGIYFSYGEANGSPPTTCILTGFVKLDGSLSILGIITLTLTFDLSLTYMSPPGSVTGTATLSVGISIFFFSFSVSVTASKTFGGGSNGSNTVRRGGVRAHVGPSGDSDTPPTFADQMAQADWNTYCQAFATN
jgi:hypothetical protein